MMKMLRVIPNALGLLALAVSQAVAAGAPLIDAQAYTLPSETQPMLTKSVQLFKNAEEHMLARMDALGIAMTVVMPNPQPANETNPHDAEILAREYAGIKTRVAVLGGGGSLNRTIQKAVVEGGFDEEDRRFFMRRAKELLDAGAKGFGEIALDKFATGVDGTQYQHASPNHPLVKLLAEIAAENDVALVVHMEPIGQAMPRKDKMSESLYPDTLQPNLPAFMELLAQNRRTRFLWAHLGADVTPVRRPPLVRKMLKMNPNLYMALSPTQRNVGKPHGLMDEAGHIATEWLAVLQDFPDRFLLGSGQFYLPEKMPIHVDYRPKAAGAIVEAGVAFLTQLPPELARRIGFENAVQFYKLPVSETKP